MNYFSKALLFVVCCLFTLSLNTLANETLVVQDFLAREVSLKQPAKRIIALAPHIVENLYSAGAGKYLVGVVEHCDYPEAARKLPKVGAISHYSLEAILNLKPDLVIVWHAGYGIKILNKLQQLKIKTYVSNPTTLPDIAKAIRDYGKLAATTQQAEKAAQKFETTLKSLRREYSAKSPVSVLYQVWNSPIQTLNDKHIISDVIRLCGGSNAFGDAPTLAPKLSVESVISRDPQVIIASGMGEERPEWLSDWKKWQALAAVKKNNLYFIPPDLIQRHTVRMLQGAKLMCQHLQASRKNL
ncbi:MAG: cobalamin-binding protein [Cellvibrionaceae bacterium]|nr:cobalamin-binding protein [Cellvibrionaceae bacterium]